MSTTPIPPDFSLPEPLLHGTNDDGLDFSAYSSDQMQEAFDQGLAAGLAAGKPKKAKKTGPTPERPADVTEQTWADFLQLRQAKKAPFTATALAVIVNAAKTVNFTTEEALRTCCANGWQGFRADWVTPKKATGNLSNRSYGDNGADNDGFLA